MATYYWVGGAGTWNATTTTNWASTSGGAGGAGVPTVADFVYFDANSGAGVVTLSGSPAAGLLTCTGFTGSWAGSGALTLAGDFVLPAGTLNASSYTGTITITSSCTIDGGTGTFGGNLNINTGTTLLAVQFFSAATTLTITGTTTITSGRFDSTTGTFTTGSFVTANNASAKSIQIKSPTITGNFDISIGSGTVTFSQTAGFTMTLSGATSSIATKGVTFAKVAFTSTSGGARSITGVNTFNTITITGRSTSGVGFITFNNNQTIGTLVVNAGAFAYCRTMLQSNLKNTVRTLTCTTATTITDTDFQNITISGTTASGTRLGDCGGNTGITFPASKTVYFVGATNFQAAVWATSSGGAGASTNFPLAQDTAIFDNFAPAASGSTTVTAEVNVGFLDFSSRTSAMTFTILSASTPLRVNLGLTLGSGVTWSSNGALSFNNGQSTTILVNSAGKSIQCAINIDLISTGSVWLSSALSSGGVITLNSGTFYDNAYATTCAGFSSSVTTIARQISIDGTFTINGLSNWSVAATNLTVSGTGSIVMSGTASPNSFAGAGIQTYPTLVNNASATLYITGSNKFANITNPYSATGATAVAFGAGDTNEFTAFNLTGTVGKVCTLSSTIFALQATLKKPGSWQMGANSTDGGGNTGLSFTAGGGIDYLAVSNINGISSGTTYASTITETATGTDSILAAVLFRSSITETASGTDQISTLAVLNPSVSETGTATDAITTTAISYTDINETGSASDIAAVAVAFASSVAETSTGSDVIAATMAHATSITETSSASDQVQSAGIFGTVVLETSTGSDAISALVSFGSAIVEVAATSDALSAAVVFGSIVNETGAATDQIVGSLTLSSTITETSTAQDQIAGGLLLFSSTSETASATDQAGATMLHSTLVVDTATGTDSTSAVGVFGTLVQEIGNVTDTPIATAAMSAQVVELVTGTDSLVGGLVYLAQIAESATAYDIIFAALLWELIDDSQIANWTPIVDTQLAGWTQVDDTQAPNWQNVNDSQTPGWGQIDDTQTPGWQDIQT